MFFKTHINLFIFLTIMFNTSFAKNARDNYIDFDVEGARYTSAQSINESGMVTGNYTLFNNRSTTNGFIRMPTGNITKFSVPGVEFTYPVGINNAGMVTGTARSDIDSGTTSDCNHVAYCESFVRTLDGKITTFAVPGAKGGTLAVGINDSGTITGYAKKNDSYDDNDTQGFVRQADGTIIIFDVPGAKYTKPTSINNKGVITGCYNIIAKSISCYGASDGGHGFIRMTDGTFITFDVPEKELTYPTAINDNGEITGVYERYPDDDTGAFFRTPNGEISTFNIENAGMDKNSLKINKEGVILGNYFTIMGSNLHGGFTRELSGEIKKWSHPNDKENFTLFHDINGAGMIVGEYPYYGAWKSHSFLLNTK